MTINFENKKAEFNLGEEFIKNGGEILEFYPDGWPANWKCGKKKDDTPIHPEGMTKEAIPYINESGEPEGCNPNKEFLEQVQDWRSDWTTPEESQEKMEEK